MSIMSGCVQSMSFSYVSSVSNLTSPVESSSISLGRKMSMLSSLPT
uniref:Uncharacterized protein n=1 Tax=Anguilla anguilla TaxID=7936 RepID=A0A0E9XRE0_ANGAN